MKRSGTAGEKYVTCSSVTVSATDQSRPASTSFVQASAHTTSRRHRYVVSPALTSTPAGPRSRTDVTGVSSTSAAPWRLAIRCIVAVPRPAGTIEPRRW